MSTSPAGRRAGARRLLAHASAISMLLFLTALAGPVLGVQGGNPPGNNGTVKVHDGDTETEPIVHNQPHVCDFHLHFFFADAGQTGDWWIESWPPTGDGTTVLSSSTEGAYLTDSNGEDRKPDSGDTYALADGHYKLFWYGAANPGGQQNLKHKVFWVECEEPGPPPPSDADVTVEKSASDDSVDAGDSFTYTLVVTNLGDETATGVVVDDTTLDLPLGLSSPVASQGSCTISASNNLHCDLGDIVGGGTVTITFTATTSDEACPIARNHATVNASNDSNTENNTSNTVEVEVVCEEQPPSPPDDDDEDNDAALNIKKVDEDGRRLAGAVFTVEGFEGTFATGRNGKFCITGLPDDSEWLVTEIQAPPGYEIADPAWELVEVDNDGDCDSPDATFVNTRAEEESPPEEEESPSEAEAPSQAQAPSQPQSPSQPQAAASTPRESELAAQSGQLPNTATEAPVTVPTWPFAALVLVSLARLLWLRVARRSMPRD